MPKTYLRYEEHTTLGQITSQHSNICFNINTKTIFTSRIHFIQSFNAKTSSLGHRYTPPKLPATQLTNITKLSISKSYLAAASLEGNIFLFNILTGEFLSTFFGHNSSVESLCFNEKENYLFSGGKDGKVFVWDTIAQRGVCGLKGHIGKVTNVGSFGEILVSSSVDGFLKFWDVENQECIRTVGGFGGRLLDFYVDGNQIFCLTAENEIRVINVLDLKVDDGVSMVHGSLKGKNVGKFQQVKLLESKIGEEKFIAIRCKGKNIEVYRKSSEKEIKKKLKRRRSKHKEKENEEEKVQTHVSDLFEHFCSITAKHEIKSFELGEVLNSSKPFFEVILSLKTNTLETFKVKCSKDTTSKKRKKSKEKSLALGFLEVELTNSISVNGHRSDVRCCAVDRVDKTFITCDSSGQIKIWSLENFSLLGTAKITGTKDEKYILCCMFVPGDEYCLVGTKAGVIHLVDCVNFEIIRSIQAHQEKKSVFSMSVHPNLASFVSVSSDKEAKFWNFSLEDGQVDILHIRTLQLNEEILFSKYSNSLSAKSNLVCFSLLDNTIKVFLEETLSFRLSLYGHKLPVVAFDISTDDSLLVSASADKNIKIWGLDFGDCHRSIFAHDLPLTCINFIAGTHQFLTGSRDGFLKFWDADTFSNITMIRAHVSEMWGLSTSNTKSADRFILTTGNDKSIKLYKRGRDIIFPEEEQKRLMMETEADEGLLRNVVARNGAAEFLEDDIEADAIPAILAEQKEEKEAFLIGMGQNQAAEDALLNSTEKLIQALDFFDEDFVENKVSILKFYKLTKEQYLLKILQSMKSSEIDQTLLLLPYNYTLVLMVQMGKILEEQENVQVEKLTKIVIRLLQFNFKQLTRSQNKAVETSLQIFKSVLRSKLQRYRNTIGYNTTVLIYRQEKNLEDIP
eukprot:snap_masked-scaffold_24-processed-gene-5.28-mRNA-1 protein AED:1.00 eAED:1.00 QI:0/0/0/0/1/1/3/0/906